MAILGAVHVRGCIGMCRCGSWDLRLASIRSMAAVFGAFDHPTYQRLQYLEDVLVISAPLRMFHQGRFVAMRDEPGQELTFEHGKREAP